MKGSSPGRGNRGDMDYELKHEREELAGGITYCQDMLDKDMIVNGEMD